jgi:hypothetical protein
MIVIEIKHRFSSRNLPGLEIAELALGPRRLRDDCAPAPREEQSVPRYFFSVYDDVISHDEEGIELPNEAAARLQALIGARDIIAAQVKRGYLVRSHWIDVSDEQGEVLFSVSFGESIDIK